MKKRAKTVINNVVANEEVNKVVADFSLRQKQRGINSAKTMVGNVVAKGSNVVADFSLRQKQRGLKSAKTIEDVAVADLSLEII